MDKNVWCQACFNSRMPCKEIKLWRRWFFIYLFIILLFIVTSSMLSNMSPSHNLNSFILWKILVNINNNLPFSTGKLANMSYVISRVPSPLVFSFIQPFILIWSSIRMLTRKLILMIVVPLVATTFFFFFVIIWFHGLGKKKELLLILAHSLNIEH